MRYRKLGALPIVAAVAGLVMLPTQSQAQGPCLTCDPDCTIIYEDGWYSCKNIPDGCLLQGAGCVGGFALLPDGRMIPEELSNQERTLTTLDVFALNSELADGVKSDADIWFRRGCDNIVIERQYSSATAAALRSTTRTLKL